MATEDQIDDDNVGDNQVPQEQSPDQRLYGRKAFGRALGDARSKKIVIVMGVVIVICFVVAYAAINVFEQSSSSPQSKATRAPSNVKSTNMGQGSKRLSKLKQKQNKQDYKKAKKNGTSFQATLTNSASKNTGIVPKPRYSSNNNKSGSKFQAPKNHSEPHKSQKQNHTQQGTRSSKPSVASVNEHSRSKHNSGIYQNMHQQANEVLKSMKLAKPVSMTFKQHHSSNKTGQNKISHSKSISKHHTNRNPSHAKGPLIAKAGATVYAVLQFTADSDQPGPVKARIVSGHLRGDRLIGRFQKKHNKITIHFNTLAGPNIPTTSIKAVGYNPNSKTTGLATSVNHHWLERFGGLILGKTLQGYGQAVAQSGSTTTTSGLSAISSIQHLSPTQKLLVGAGTAGRAVGNALKQNVNRPTTVIVSKNTPLGVMFLKNVRLGKSPPKPKNNSGHKKTITQTTNGQSQNQSRSKRFRRRRRRRKKSLFNSGLTQSRSLNSPTVSNYR